MIKIRRALISVSDKTGVVELGQTLQEAGVAVLSTGGTAKALREGGVRVTDVSDVTRFPECLEGRVKTVHAGILADRSKPEHLDQLRELNVEPIDLVVVNLYPFEETVDRGVSDPAQLVEKIDIGGPTMLRAAAKNHTGVVVVCDPEDYPRLTAELAERGGVSRELSRTLAAKVFRHTGVYDAAISAALGAEDLNPDQGRWPLGLVAAATLRYGENPHQKGALYRPAGEKPQGFASLKQLQGKALSYNNYLDMYAAYGLAGAFRDPTAVIVKHQNPCGVGFDADMAVAFQRALDADPVSAFGGVVALNQPLTPEAAQAMTQLFLEVIVAPQVEAGALEVLGKKKNLRVIECEPAPPPLGLEVRPVMGAWLVQTQDSARGVGARRRSDRGGRRARDRHGVHRPTQLPSLSRSRRAGMEEAREAYG